MIVIGPGADAALTEAAAMIRASPTYQFLLVFLAVQALRFLAQPPRR